MVVLYFILDIAFKYILIFILIIILKNQNSFYSVSLNGGRVRKSNKYYLHFIKELAVFENSSKSKLAINQIFR